MKKVIDTFPYFNEKELLELRIELLRDHVDKFIISELSHTHSGIPKPFTCKQTIKELGLPEHMIEVIETTVSAADLVPTEIDLMHAAQASSLKDVSMWIRERIQRDAVINGLLDVDDDVVIINGDCDEIIKPDVVEYFSGMVRSNEYILKVPLVSLEGAANKRLFDVNGQPIPWQNSLFMCKMSQLRNKSISTFRGNTNNPYPLVWATQDGQVIQDCGWHFTWMGDVSRKREKMRSFIHSANTAVINNLSGSSFDMIRTAEIETMQTRNVLQDYPLELLPKEIFELPRVKEYLLPDIEYKPVFTMNKIQKTRLWVVDDFYENPYAMRNYALAQPFFDGGIGRGFIGKRSVHQYLFPGLKERFEEIMGIKITEWESHGMNGRFQTSLAGEPLVYHCDSQRWAGMLFLTPDAPFECGTTLYAHRQTRIRHSSHPNIMETFKPGNLDKTPYQAVDVAGNVFNRLVIFDAGSIHAASEYFGFNIYNCRLWQMFFFD